SADPAKTVLAARRLGGACRFGSCHVRILGQVTWGARRAGRNLGTLRGEHEVRPYASPKWIPLDKRFTSVPFSASFSKANERPQRTSWGCSRKDLRWSRRRFPPTSARLLCPAPSTGKKNLGSGAAAKSRCPMENGTTWSRVPWTIKMGARTRRILASELKRLLRRYSNRGMRKIRRAISFAEVKELCTIKPPHSRLEARSMATAPPSECPKNIMFLGWICRSRTR